MTAHAPITAADQPIRTSKARLFWPLIAAQVLAAAALQSAIIFNHDVAWILMSAEWVLDGGEIGKDIIDLNPPLIWWFSTIPVAISRALGIGLAGGSTVTTLGLCLASIALSRLALNRLPMSDVSKDRFLLFAAAVLLLLPGYDFAQREHYFLIAALPYLIAAAAAAEGKPIGPGHGAAIGLFCAIGFCLKPHFLLLPVLTELFVLARTRRIWPTIRAETLALPIVGIAYVAAVAIWAPAYLSAALPDAALSYWAYDSDPLEVGRRLLVMSIPIAAAIMLAGGGLSTHRGLFQFLLAGALAAGAVAFYQLKGWPYHLLPPLGLGCMAAFACCCAPFDEKRRSPRTAAAVALLLIVVFTKPAEAFVYASGPGAKRVEELTTLLRREVAPNDTVYAFATSGRDLTPALLASGARWAAPVGGPYLLPAAVRADGPRDRQAMVQQIADRQLALIFEWLERGEPALIFFDDKKKKLGFGNHPFDYVDYLQRYPRFRAIMERYAEREPVAGFRVFVRKASRS